MTREMRFCERNTNLFGFPSVSILSKYMADLPQLSARGMLTGTVTRVLGDTTLLVRSMYYDHHGNVIQTHESNTLGGYEHTYSHLSFTGKPLRVMRVHSTADTVMTDVHSYTYDNMERLLTASVSRDGGEEVQLAQNSYNRLGQLSGQWLGGSLDGVTYYSYNVRGWTTGIDNPHFGQRLHYQDASAGATPCYNGNISAMEWTARDAMMSATAVQHQYRYSYDGLNRLTAADYATADEHAFNGGLMLLGGQQRDYDCTYQYDLNGNVTSLTRKGVDLAMPVMDYTAWNYGTIDDLSLSYEGNRLTKVTDQSPDLTYEGAMDFRDGVDRSTEYTYDTNGNLTSDRNKGITAIAYNVLNLPSRVEFDDGHIIRYRYAADGRKLRTEYVLSNIMVIDNPGYGPSFSNSPSELQGAGGSVSGGVIDGPPENQLETTLMTRDYCGNVIYRDGALERLQGDYGYMDSTGNYHYYIKDYQGNVRAVIDHFGTLEEVNNYYPYGALMGGGTVNNPGIQPYKYGTKELDRQNGLDWYDSQARMYDPLLGRTPTMDPLAEKYYPISPYAWCGGNPLRFIDPNGEEIINGDGEVLKWETELEYLNKLSQQDMTDEQRERLNRQIERIKANLKQAAETQRAIEDYAETDPYGFAIFNNLTYFDDEGNERNLDIIVKTIEGGSSESPAIDFFKTEAPDSRNITDDRIYVLLSATHKVSDALAHEFGHTLTISRNPAMYAFIINCSNNNCQDPFNRIPYISKDALFWQIRYNILKNRQENKKF